MDYLTVESCAFSDPTPFVSKANKNFKIHAHVQIFNRQSQPNIVISVLCVSHFASPEFSKLVQIFFWLLIFDLPRKRSGKC